MVHVFLFQVFPVDSLLHSPLGRLVCVKTHGLEVKRVAVLFTDLDLRPFHFSQTIGLHLGDPDHTNLMLAILEICLPPLVFGFFSERKRWLPGNVVSCTVDVSALLPFQNSSSIISILCRTLTGIREHYLVDPLPVKS